VFHDSEESEYESEDDLLADELQRISANREMFKFHWVQQAGERWGHDKVAAVPFPHYFPSPRISDLLAVETERVMAVNSSHRGVQATCLLFVLPEKETINVFSKKCLSELAVLP
jgi:hypothetical protein